MTRIQDWRKERQVDFGDQYNLPWDEKSGREIFAQRSITSLNKIPVSVHTAYALGGTHQHKPLPFTVERLCEGLIVDGTIVIRTEDGEAEFLTGILEATPRQVVRRLPRLSPDGHPVTRVYTLTGERWAWKDYEDYHLGDDGRKVIDEKKVGVGKDDLYVYPNGPGILFTAQDTYNRLEEIKRRTRIATNNALGLIVSGYAGDWDQFAGAWGDREDGDTVSIPEKVSVTQVASTALVDQYLADFENLVGYYLKKVHMIEVPDDANISGVARKLVMTPMLYYTRGLQAHIATILEETHNPGAVTFTPVTVQTPRERMEEMNLLTAAQERGVITEEEFKERARALIG